MSAPVRRVLMMPDWRDGNPYQSLLTAALQRRGFEVALRPMPKGLFALSRLPRAELGGGVIHLHWVNDLIAPALWSANPLVRWAKRALLGLDVVATRLRGTRVVWTVHNLVGHETDSRERELAARRMLARACDHLLFHSESALRRVESAYRMGLGHKSSIVPHGNYDGCYPGDPEDVQGWRARLGIDPEDTVLLFFGAVRKYKGVAQLVEAFSGVVSPRLKLVIAGNPHPPELGAAIAEAACRDPRVVALLRFVADDEVAPLFALADAVVIPFERTLTSGSLVLALTMGKATLVPAEARVFDLVDDASALFFDSAAGLQALIGSLDRDDLRRRGHQARLRADALGWDAIAQAVAAVYEGRKPDRAPLPPPARP